MDNDSIDAKSGSVPDKATGPVKRLGKPVTRRRSVVSLLKLVGMVPVRLFVIGACTADFKSSIRDYSHQREDLA